MKARKNLFKALAMILAIAMILTVAGCAGGGSSGTSSATESSKTTEESTGGETSEDAGTTPASAGPDDTTEPYEFSAYYNYAGSVKPWGEDAASKYMNEKFNITLHYSCPDADADAKLNLMISSDDLPEVVICDRNATWLKMINLGVLVDVNTLKYEGNTLDQDLLESTQKLLSVNDGL